MIVYIFLLILLIKKLININVNLIQINYVNTSDTDPNV
jgi:hypothetical protein